MKVRDIALGILNRLLQRLRNTRRRLRNLLWSDNQAIEFDFVEFLCKFKQRLIAFLLHKFNDIFHRTFNLI